MTNFFYPVRGVGTVNFTEALLVGGASAMNALPGLPAVNSRRFFLRAISVVSVQQLGMIFQFYGSASGATADVDTNRFISSVGLVSGQAVRYAGTGLYLYYMDGLSVPYYADGSGNEIAKPSLFVTLQIQGATAKLADAAGAIHPVFWFEPASAMP